MKTPPSDAKCELHPSNLGPHLLVGALAAALLLSAAVAARADWLVTSDGARIETRGAWSERGDLVVFNLADGSLASLKRSQVDLEASRAETERAATADRRAREDSSAAPAKKSVLVLTDADVGHSSGTRAPTEHHAAAEAPVEGPVSSTPGGQNDPLQVVSWREGDREEGDGLFLTGTVRNTGNGVAAAVAMSATLFDPDGKVLATVPSTLGASALAPGQTANFRTDLPGIFSFSGVAFDFSYQALRSTATPPEAQATQRREEG